MMTTTSKIWIILLDSKLSRKVIEQEIIKEIKLTEFIGVWIVHQKKLFTLFAVSIKSRNTILDNRIRGDVHIQIKLING